jgi:hypothetical protein
MSLSLSLSSLCETALVSLLTLRVCLRPLSHARSGLKVLFDRMLALAGEDKSGGVPSDTVQEVRSLYGAL